MLGALVAERPDSRICALLQPPGGVATAEVLRLLLTVRRLQHNPRSGYGCLSSCKRYEALKGGAAAAPRSCSTETLACRKQICKNDTIKDGKVPSWAASYIGIGL